MWQREIVRVGSAIALSMLMAGTAVGRNGRHSVAAGATQKTPAALRGAAHQRHPAPSHFRQGRHSQFHRARTRPTAGLAYWPHSYLNYGVYPLGYGYGQSSHFPYLYFFDHYAREADESRRAADEFEASLAREGKLTGPERVGDLPTDYLPYPPPGVTLILDGEGQGPSPSGATLVIESGEHTLHIAAKPRPGSAAPSTN